MLKGEKKGKGTESSCKPWNTGCQVEKQKRNKSGITYTQTFVSVGVRTFYFFI